MLPARSTCWAAIAILALLSCSDDETPVSNDPSTVLAEFYEYGGAEDTLMDPLIVAGEAVVPLLIDRVQNTDMPKRRYAIGALGNIGDSRAIPMLETLSRTEEELSYIRCDSVQAVAQIDWRAGRALASEFADSIGAKPEIPECLSRVATQILELERDEWLARTGIVRSLKDAKRRRHY